MLNIMFSPSSKIRLPFSFIHRVLESSDVIKQSSVKCNKHNFEVLVGKKSHREILRKHFFNSDSSFSGNW